MEKKLNFAAILALTLFLACPAKAGSLNQLKDSGAELKSVLPVPAKAEAEPAAGSGLCVFNSASGLAITPDAFAGAIQASDMVYVGETHDQANDHLAQLEALKTLAASRGAKIAVGFEMLNMTLQPVLDDYAAGKLTQEEFLAKADWQKEWGFDFNIYKPIFDFIVQNKLRAIALNVPKKIVSKVARSGLDSLTPEERVYLPETVAITEHKEYLAYLRENYDSMHASKFLSFGDYMSAVPAVKNGGEPAFLAPEERKSLPAASKGKARQDRIKALYDSKPMPQVFTWENYLAAMCTWNEGMGSRIAAFANANPGWAVMTVAGNGHVMYNAAIPASVKTRVENVRQVSFYTEGADQCPASAPAGLLGLADNIWFTAHTAAAGK